MNFFMEVLDHVYGSSNSPKPLLDVHTRLFGQVDFILSTLVLDGRISESESRGTDWRKRGEAGTA